MAKLHFGPIEHLLNTISQIAPQHIATINPIESDPIPIDNETVLLASTIKNNALTRVVVPVPSTALYLLQLTVDENDPNRVGRPENFQVYEFGVFNAHIESVINIPDVELKNTEYAITTTITYRPRGEAGINYRIQTDVMIALSVVFQYAGKYVAALPILRFTSPAKDKLKRILRETEPERLKNDWISIKEELDNEFKITYNAIKQDASHKKALYSVLVKLDEVDTITRLKMIANLYRVPMSKRKKEIWQGGVPDNAITLENIIINTRVSDNRQVDSSVTVDL